MKTAKNVKPTPKAATHPTVPPTLPPRTGGGRTAGSLMSTSPVIVAPENSLKEAVRRMVDEDVRHLPVVDAMNCLVGMISDRDVREAVGNPQEFSETTDRDDGDEPTVASVMTRDPVAVTADASVEEVAQTLIAGRFGAVPVVDDKDRLVGIVSYIDVLRAFVPEA
ncbi:MAG TPA: CBS domain-containing protein [bacterium]|nr:CBS domain-containing protein [bacterium]